VKRFFLLIPIVLLNSCFFGTFRTAEPVGAGNVEKSVWFNVPLYYTRDYRENAKKEGTFYPKANLGAMLNFGAAENMDFGVQFDFSMGLGPQVKYRLLHYEPVSVALGTGFAYNFFAEGFSWNVDLLLSGAISPYTVLYSGLLLHHAPDYRISANEEDFSNISDFRNFFGIAVGVAFRNFRIASLIKGANMEVVFPIDQYPPFIWGFNFCF